jgi:PAS domain S-box-containing protein
MSHKISMDPQALFVSRTDKNGIIEYVNGDFCKISGYQAEELMHHSHNIVRHPDMPAVIFKMMWNRLKNNEDIFAVVKNLAKNGDYYWVTTQFEIRKHPYENHVVGYVAHRREADAHVVDEISKLYAELLKIEKYGGIKESEDYFINYLNTKKMTYDEYIHNLAVKGSLFKSIAKKYLAGINLF